MRRVSFLSLFLIGLSIAFVIALAFRIRSYTRTELITPVKPRLETTAVETAAQLTGAPAPSPAVAAEAAAPHQTVRTENKAAVRARLREQLIREAQTQPQSVSPPVVPTQPKIAPTAKPKALPAPTSTPRAASQPPSRTSPSAQSSASSEVGRSSSRPAEGPKDPNSDVTPPQLNAIEFDPPQIHDGEEARIIITATDDLSGIRGVSGTITSPTGKALQGFACQREADTTRYIGRCAIPKNGEEGLWRVNILTMSDNASNSVTLSYAQGTVPQNAVLRVVSSQSDSTPPTLKSVRVDKRSMRVGEPNPIYIEAEDDKSGVNLVSAVFVSPTKLARIGAGCRHGEGDLWQCDLSLPSCVDCGDWQLEQVTLQDKANNLATYRTDNPIVQAVKINITGDACDSEPPRLLSLNVDPMVVNIGREPAVVTVTIRATDDACGVAGVSGQYAGPGTGSGGFFPLQPSGDESTWVGRIPLDPRAPRGVWRITSIQLTDKGHNLRIYYANDPLLANGTFQIR